MKKRVFNCVVQGYLQETSIDESWLLVFASECLMFESVEVFESVLL